MSCYDFGRAVDEMNLDDSSLHNNDLNQKFRSRILHRFLPVDCSTFYGSKYSLSLLDTLPMFMALSAVQNVLQGHSVTELWMQLAARYMVQAVIEQYLIYGRWSKVIFKEAFAYGFNAEHEADDQDEDDLIIANMFWGGELEGELRSWKEIRDEHSRAVS